jgi:hypothetical protein
VAEVTLVRHGHEVAQVLEIEVRRVCHGDICGLSKR